ncbi:MAG: cytoplasmic protein [Pseudomonadota bacterium]
MGRHTHDFVNTYDEGKIVFGLDRKTDEKSLIAYLQKFTDDELMQILAKRLSDDEIREVIDYILGILKRHLKEEEYHRFFLK